MPGQILEFEKVVNGERAAELDDANIRAATGKCFDFYWLGRVMFHDASIIR